MTHEHAIEILCENIRLFSERTDDAERQRAFCVRQLTERLCSKKESSSLHECYEAFRLALEDSRPRDRATFCMTFSERFRSKESFLSTEPVAAGSHGRIALVRNRLNEEAYGIFSHVITAAKAHALPSFSDTCEDVFDNRCEFGILPLENTADGKLFGFYAMLDRYELRICAACHLETDRSEGTIRYALIGKNLPSRIPKQAEWNFECSVVAELGRFPSDITEIAPLFGAVLIKIDSLPLLYDDRLQKIYFTFRIPEHRAEAFHWYLTLEHARYSMIGIYPVLNALD